HLEVVTVAGDEMRAGCFDLFPKLLERKVAVVPGTAFNCDPASPSSSVRLNYSMPSEEQIVEGCRILGETVREML
ncbi:MAG: hypothetical protein II797_05270, partial [Clostridia bacterium]|nr:hypothetical protein [Clostridia bacterium]